jgi:orotidine-5'-phosphate decarboxylase
LRLKEVSKFQKKLDKIVKKNNSLVCVGLDSSFDKLPSKFRRLKHPQFEFNKTIIEATHKFVCAYKPNTAFYEARGDRGIGELKMTMDYLKEYYPEICTILDAKRADIGSTNEGYVACIFDWLGFDAVTLHPYLGSEALAPFLKRKEKGCIILCRTSNPGAEEFQDLKVGKELLYQVVARKVVSKLNKNSNCLLVAGATYPDELKKIRKIVGDMTLLVPGIGAQGGDVKKTVKAGLNSKGAGMIINSSRGIIFSDNPHKTASQLREEVNKYR